VKPGALRTVLRVLYGVLVLAVLVIALLPAPDAVEVFSWDKLNHMAAFVVLACCAKLLWPSRNFVRPFLLLALFGIAIEVLQWDMGFGRDADWRDVVADVIATLVGLAIARGILALRTSGDPVELGDAVEREP
jgi:glycopeptide antibiotics resistance protein